MTSRVYDAVLIGGGHNGLVCAAYLAAAGLDVCVLERRDVVGGAAVTEEFHPGFRNSTASYTVSLLDPQVIRDLKLAAHGLSIVERPFANFLPLSATPGDYLKVGGGLEATQRELARFSRRDAEALPAYYAMLDRVADVLRELMHRTPPDVANPERREHPGARRRVEDAALVQGARPRGAARRRRPLHEERGRDPRPPVRVRADQGGVRVRRGRRQLRVAVHAGLRVRAAAPRVRRGERQARPVGPREAAAWARSRRRWRRSASARGVDDPHAARRSRA